MGTSARAEPEAFRRFLACELGVDASDVVFWDLMFHDVEPGALIGRDEALISAPRLDNLASCWAAVHAISPPRPDVEADVIQVIVLFDHEEIGSTTNRGAASSLLDTTLERITRGLGGDRDAWHRALAGSICLSADMAHATHPNYPDRHEPGHWIALDGGPVVKTNASQRYATDARFGRGVHGSVRPRRCSGAAVRPPRRSSVRLDDRSDHGGPSRRHRPSTWARRNSRCTRPAS